MAPEVVIVTPEARSNHSGRVLLVGLVVLCLLLPLTSISHRHVDAWAPRTKETESIRFMPSGTFLKGASLGYSALLADLMWLRATALFGSRYGDGDRSWYSWVFHMIDTATDLDPRFRAAYKYGGTILRLEGVFIDQSSLIFQKGMLHRPDEWYFPFGIAMNYYLHHEDMEQAARYMELAATRGGPFYLRNLAATLRTDADNPTAALTFVEEELKNLVGGDDNVRGALLVKRQELKHRVGAMAVQRVVEEYRRQHGKLPEHPADVVEAGLSLPEDWLGGTWQWSPNPKAEIGTVISSRYCETFAVLSRSFGLGKVSEDDCPKLADP